MTKTAGNIKKKPIAKNGSRSKITTGGKKIMSDGYNDGLKLGPDGIYRYRLMVNGKVRTGNTGMTRLFDAERELTLIKAELIQDTQGKSRKKTPTFAKCMEIWEEKKRGLAKDDYIKNTLQVMKIHFTPHIGHIFIDKLNQEHIEECLQLYIERTQKDRAIKIYGGYNKLIGILKGIFSFMEEYNYISRTPKLPKKHKQAEVYKDTITSEEVDQLFQVIQDRYGLTRTVAVAMGIYLGLRVSEITSAKWHMVDFENKTFRNTNETGVSTTKGKEAKSITIVEDMLPWFEQIRYDEAGNQKIGQIISKEDGSKYPRKFLEHVLEYAGEKIFHKHITAHTLRRSMITIMNKHGIDLKTIQLAARHATTAQTAAYIQVTAAEVGEAMNRALNRKAT